MKIDLIEATPGSQRRGILEQRAAVSPHSSYRREILDCNFDRGGPWAGVADLFRRIVPSLRERRPDLFEKHNLELIYALPELRRETDFRFPTLTDTAPTEEKVRNYPADRAVRLVHGLIDLLEEWHDETGYQGWTLGCDDFDRLGCIGRRFFVELVRRRGERLNLHLILGVSPEGSGELEITWPSEARIRTTRLELEADTTGAGNRDLSRQRAEELERRVGDSQIETQVFLPQVIEAWRQAQNQRKVWKWRCAGLEIYNTLGLYEDALRYGAGALEEAMCSRPLQKELHWAIFVKTFMSLAGLGRAEEAKELAERFLPEVEDLAQRGRLCYLIAMLYGRFLSARDLSRAEEYLDEGLRLLEMADLPLTELKFQTVFNRNGLAMIRTFQARFSDALALCQWGRETLDAHLPPASHRLHRSVLLYNMAQVHAAIGNLDQAFEQFSGAMREDPNYSEYYNERGSVLLKLGRFEEALGDYRIAIQLSPPYFEVFANLGSCYRLLGRWSEAEAAFERAVDLEPRSIVSQVGLAEATESQGKLSRAAAAYSSALALAPSRWDLLASRAVVYYQLERSLDSLADLNRAIELSPGTPDLYQNRGIAFSSLGDSAAALDDFQRYLELAPFAEDVASVSTRIKQLQENATAVVT